MTLIFMKKIGSALLISLPIAALAGEAPPSFPDLALPMPSFSLVGDSLRGLPQVASTFGPEAAPATAPVRVVSYMPILAPAGAADSKMIRIPDPTLDYKMIVKKLSVEPVK